MRVAWSIADLGGIEIPGKEEIERALELRVGIKGE
jgi:predicted ATPase with chaperone activity